MREICSDDALSRAKFMDVEISSESNIFVKKNLVYKIFKDDLGKKARDRKERKVEILSGIKTKTKGLVLPIDKIVVPSGDRRIFVGYTMPFIRNSQTLFDYAVRRNNNIEYLALLSRISKTLRAIHNLPEDIVIGDLNFFNILVDKSLHHYFIDLDGAMISGMENDRVPSLTARYFATRRIPYCVNVNTDRLTMLLYFYNSIFARDIHEVKRYEYDKRSEQIKALKDLKNLFRELKRGDRKVPHIPYLDEVFGNVNSYSKLSLKRKY